MSVSPAIAAEEAIPAQAGYYDLLVAAGRQLDFVAAGCRASTRAYDSRRARLAALAADGVGPPVWDMYGFHGTRNVPPGAFVGGPQSRFSRASTLGGQAGCAWYMSRTLAYAAEYGHVYHADSTTGAVVPAGSAGAVEVVAVAFGRVAVANVQVLPARTYSPQATGPAADKHGNLYDTVTMGPSQPGVNPPSRRVMHGVTNGPARPAAVMCFPDSGGFELLGWCIISPATCRVAGCLPGYSELLPALTPVDTSGQRPAKRARASSPAPTPPAAVANDCSCDATTGAPAAADAPCAPWCGGAPAGTPTVAHALAAAASRHVMCQHTGHNATLALHAVEVYATTGLWVISLTAANAGNFAVQTARGAAGADTVTIDVSGDPPVAAIATGAHVGTVLQVITARLEAPDSAEAPAAGSTVRTGFFLPEMGLPPADATAAADQLTALCAGIPDGAVVTVVVAQNVPPADRPAPARISAYIDAVSRAATIRAAATTVPTVHNTARAAAADERVRRLCMALAAEA